MMEPERSDSIQDIVESAFAYLEDECGFVRKNLDKYGASYEKDGVLILVFRDWRSGSTGVTAGRIGRSEYFPLERISDLHPEFPRVVSSLEFSPHAVVEQFLIDVARQARRLLCALDAIPASTFDALARMSDELGTRSDAAVEREISRIQALRIARSEPEPADGNDGFEAFERIERQTAAVDREFRRALAARRARNEPGPIDVEALVAECVEAWNRVERQRALVDSELERIQAARRAPHEPEPPIAVRIAEFNEAWDRVEQRSDVS